MNHDFTNQLHEADIGSGEKSPGERDTEEMIKKISWREDSPTANKTQPVKKPANNNLLDHAAC